MTEGLLRLQTDVFRALAHPTRLRIVELLQGRERCVCELLETLHLEQSNVSQHLSILRQAGLIASRREAARVIYTCANPFLGSLLEASADVTRHALQEAARLIEPNR